jgi:iron complex transport system substrate-binding protein
VFGSCAPKRQAAVLVPPAPKTVAALSSSIAEMWLLAGGSLAGVSADAFAAERGFALPDGVANLGGIFSPSVERLLNLKPDLVLLSRDIAAHRSLAETLRTAHIPAVLVKVETLDEYLSALRDFTGMTGDAAAFERNGRQMREQADALLAQLPADRGRKSALFFRAHSSGITAITGEHQVCAILSDIGVNVVGGKTAGGRASTLNVSVEHIIEADPDFIFAVFQGDEDKARASFAASFAAHPAWVSLRAVRDGRFIVLPKALFHFKPNSRWAQAYEHLLRIVYPETYAAE